MVVPGVLLLILLLFFVLRPMFQKVDTCVLYVGGLGSGKSLTSCKMALKLLRRNRFRARINNLIHPLNKQPRPLLYSTIPVRISRREWSIPLSDLTPVLAFKIVPRSVVFMDEVSLWLDQMTINPIKMPKLPKLSQMISTIKAITNMKINLRRILSIKN